MTKMKTYGSDHSDESSGGCFFRILVIFRIDNVASAKICKIQQTQLKCAATLDEFLQISDFCDASIYIGRNSSEMVKHPEDD